MQFSLILALSAAGLAQANIQGAVLLRRHLESFPARATPVSDSTPSDSDSGSGSGSDNALAAPSSQCVSEAMSIITSIPTPAPALLSEIENNAASDLSDICNFSVPSSLSADLSSYAASLSSWTDQHMTELLDFGKSCGTEGTAVYSSLLAQCTTTAGASPTKLGGPSRISATATASGTAEATGHATSGSGSNSTQPVKTGAAGQTGVSAFLLAAAGIAVLAL